MSAVVKESLTTAADGKHYRVKYLLKGYSVNQRLNRLEQLQQPYQHIGYSRPGALSQPHWRR